MMNIIPIIKCTDMKKALAFYTRVLDFELEGIWPENELPAFSILKRDGQELHLSSHSGDGVLGTAVAIIVTDIDTVFRKFIKRGLKRSSKKDSPVHQGVVVQTWGTREFYVDDPDGNTIRFIQR